MTNLPMLFKAMSDYIMFSEKKEDKKHNFL